LAAPPREIQPPPEPVTEEIIAWRGWMILGEPNDPRLCSLTRMSLWDGPTVTADQKPDRDSTHGLYALRDRAGLREMRRDAEGEVSLSGVVVEGTNGYRAERATVRSIVLANNPCPEISLMTLADLLAVRYQCEVTWTEEAVIRRAPTDTQAFYSQPIALPQILSTTTQVNPNYRAWQQYLLQQQAMRSQNNFGPLGNALGGMLSGWTP
jgi:hypothetical protein